MRYIKLLISVHSSAILTDIHQQRRGGVLKGGLEPPLRQDDGRLKRGREGINVLPGLHPGR